MLYRFVLTLPRVLPAMRWWRAAHACFALGLVPLSVWAQVGVGSKAASNLPQAPYQYFAPPVSAMLNAPDAQGSKPRTPGQQRVVALYVAGDYVAAGDEGIKLMVTEKLDDGVQLQVANSLAWTGRLDEALRLYQGVADPVVAPDANVGIANVLRWQNRDHQAVPVYLSVLKDQPGHEEARNGLLLAQRELAPRTTTTFGTMSDSNQFRREGLTVNHRWRTNEGYGKFEMEVNGVHDTMPDASDANNTVDMRQYDATMRYQALDREYKPALELSLPAGQGSKTPYGGLKLQWVDNHLQTDVGFVNWGRLSNNANALALGLGATHVGVNIRGMSVLGEMTGELHHYAITDSNEIWYGGARLVSKWQPLGSHIKIYTGLDYRQASFYTPNYWSPETGYGSVHLGLQGNWEEDVWNFYAQGHVGTGVYGEAGDSWSAAAGARRWLTRDIALGFNLWAMSSQRNNTQYTAQTVNVVLEKVWR